MIKMNDLFARAREDREIVGSGVVQIRMTRTCSTNWWSIDRPPCQTISRVCEPVLVVLLL